MSTLYTYHTSDTEGVGNRVYVFAASTYPYASFGNTAFARKHYGALSGRAQGYSRNEKTMFASYAIQVANENKHALPTLDILRNIDQFLTYATAAKSITFHITDFTKQMKRVHPTIVKRFFVGAHKNCVFPQTWSDILEPVNYDFE